MGSWNFIRDMFVFDWLFGHRKKEYFGERCQRESQRHADHSHEDYRGGYSRYSNNDHAQQDFDDDLDSCMFDDDF